MLDFMTKMHQIRFRHYSAPPDPLAAFGGPTSKVRAEGTGGKGWGEGRGSGEGREWEGLKPPQSKFSDYVAVYISHSVTDVQSHLNHYKTRSFWRSDPQRQGRPIIYPVLTPFDKFRLQKTLELEEHNPQGSQGSRGFACWTFDTTLVWKSDCSKACCREWMQWHEMCRCTKIYCIVN